MSIVTHSSDEIRVFNGHGHICQHSDRAFPKKRLARYEEKPVRYSPPSVCADLEGNVLMLTDVGRLTLPLGAFQIRGIKANLILACLWTSFFFSAHPPLGADA